MTTLQINEVAPRDGFQSEERFIPTEQKIALIDALTTTGIARIEATSFVSPKAIPNLRASGTCPSNGQPKAVESEALMKTPLPRTA